MLCDVCSPLGVRVANKKVIESSGLDEKSYLKWGLKDKRDILAWDMRIRLLRTYHFFADPFGLNLRTMLLGAFSGLKKSYRLLSGIRHLRCRPKSETSESARKLPKLTRLSDFEKALDMDSNPVPQTLAVSYSTEWHTLPIKTGLWIAASVVILSGVTLYWLGKTLHDISEEVFP